MGTDPNPLPTPRTREAALEAATRAGYPPLELQPGQTVLGGQFAWAKFLDRASPFQITAALEALEALEAAEVLRRWRDGE